MDLNTMFGQVSTKKLDFYLEFWQQKLICSDFNRVYFD